MSHRIRGAVVSALAAVFVLGAGSAALAQLEDLPGGGSLPPAVENTGGVDAAGAGEIGDTRHGPCVKEIFDLPALHGCEDAEGRVILPLPGLKVVGPPRGAPAGEPEKLPTTGANVGDIFALGMAALAGGGILIRRLKLSLAS